jgi:thioredoxin-like negative regulator of GroEL
MPCRYAGVIFAKVDIDENEDLARACGVRAMPTFQVWQHGKVQEVIRGADPVALAAMLDRAQGV